MTNPLRSLLAFYDNTRLTAREEQMLPSPAWRRVLADYQIPVARTSLLADGRLALPEIGVTLALEKLPVSLLQSYADAVDLRRDVSASFAVGDEGALVRIQDVNHHIKTAEDLFILKEIYRTGVYDCSVDDPVVVVDVGANVGFTTLFFAGQLADAMVEGFEPVESTHARALENLSLNPELVPRISLHNYGLAPEESQGQMFFDSSRPGNATLIKDNCFTASVAEQVPVVLRKASTVIREVQERHAGRRIILKLDCEGSEYQILGELESSGALKGIDGVLAEWHRISNSMDCNTLCQLLARNGFYVCATDRFSISATVGTLHAFRKTRL